MATFSVLIVLFILGYFFWEVWLSPMARSTRELHHLNEIWRCFNDHTHSNEEIEHLLSARNWKYHVDKVELLRTFMRMLAR